MTGNQNPPVSRKVNGVIAIIEISNPPVNATSQAVRAGLLRELEAANADPAIKAIVITGAGRTFVAGGDIREFGAAPLKPILFEVCNAIETSAKPVVAAVHGTTLGGGFEIAMASHRRIAAAGTQFGLPEVKLGLVPGAGGTQRLPRLIGITAAMDMVATGKMISASEALERGAIDTIATGDLLQEALALAADAVGQPIRRTGALAAPALDGEAARTALQAIEKRARGQIAPAMAAQLVIDSALLPLNQGIAAERRQFLDLMESQQGRAMRHVFFAEREAGKTPGLESTKPIDVQIVGVCGAGAMGAGITVAFANVGYQVICAERDNEAAEAGRARIAGLLARDVKSGRITQAALNERMSRILVTGDIYRFAPCDLVIEAVYDDLDLKRTLFEKLGSIVRSDTILATNTSYLDPNAIAQNTSHKERVVGMHFFAPANIMRLLEVVRAAQTAPDVLVTALAIAKKLRKLPIVSGVREGFIGNAIYQHYRRQCEFMLEEGALPHEIDRAMEDWGLPMGPFRAFDLSGLDISWALRKRQAPTRNPAERYCTIPDQLCEQGRLGQKTGAGWYQYTDGKPKTDPHVTALLEAASEHGGITRRPFTAQEIRLRLIAAMANEGAKLLQDGTALRQGDIDLVFLNGYGWPAWLGGPMFQAQEAGLANVLALVKTMAERDGPAFAPAAALSKAAESGISIEEAARQP